MSTESNHRADELLLLAIMVVKHVNPKQADAVMEYIQLHPKLPFKNWDFEKEISGQGSIMIILITEPS